MHCIVGGGGKIMNVDLLLARQSLCTNSFDRSYSPETLFFHAHFLPIHIPTHIFPIHSPFPVSHSPFLPQSAFRLLPLCELSLSALVIALPIILSPSSTNMTGREKASTRYHSSLDTEFCVVLKLESEYLQKMKKYNV